MVNIAVVGSRNYINKQFIYKVLDKFISNLNLDVILVSGGARGVDTISKEYAISRNINIIEFKADWNKYGKSAGFIRNADIINKANIVFAFWDGKSSGTKDSINKSIKQNKHLVVYIDEIRQFNN